MPWSSSYRPGSTRQSRTMRTRVLHEEPTCRVTGCDQPSTQDDHIVGWSQREAHGLTIPQWHARSNHQGLCDEHHRAKTQTEARRGRTSKRTTPRHPGLL